MSGSHEGRFATTQWSLVLEAGRRSAPDADAALARLCEAYWFPLYVFARRHGSSPDDAADQTQEFFSQLIEKSFLETADPERGRFRTFLLTIFQRFLAKEFNRQQTVRRGGRIGHLSLDFKGGEERYADSLAGPQTAEAIFEREWALTLLTRVVNQLQSEYATKGKGELFERCRSFLAGAGGEGGYTETAAALRMSEGALRVAVHRLRERYRELLRREVGGTMTDPDAIDDELNQLRRAIRGEIG